MHTKTFSKQLYEICTELHGTGGHYLLTTEQFEAIEQAHQAGLDAKVREARKQAASDIMNLANKYANQDLTTRGSENIRNYHYFNAINKIGEFGGR